MKQVIFYIVILVSIFTCSSKAFAEFELSNALVKDISRTYGFYSGQNHFLSEIPKKYPSLSNLALIAEMNFSATFGSSIEGMDAIMTKNIEKEWLDIKGQLTDKIPEFFNIDQISELQAREFIELVSQRAQGNIESPVIETLLLFKSGFQEHPEREFLDGYKYKYENDGSGKAKGVAFSIDLPKTWVEKEAKRPNTVQMFVSENGRGFGYLQVLIKEMPLPLGEEISEKDVLEILNPKDITDVLPDGAIGIDSGKLTLENLPGYWVSFKTKVSRVRNTVDMEAIIYTIFYKNKMIQIHGQVMTSMNGKQIDRGGLEKYEKLFDQVANSFVLPDMYK